MKKNRATILIGIIILLVSGITIIAQDIIYVYKGGTVVFSKAADEIERVSLEENKTKLVFYTESNKISYSADATQIDSITFTPPTKPVADILDIVFKQDGTAEDISPMKNSVTTVFSSTLSSYYNSTYERVVANFTNTWGSTPSGYYRIDYTDNTAFKNALADGHSVELVFMTNYTFPKTSSECKPFSSHEAGGTGFLIPSISGARQNEITFLPNITKTGSSTWIWGTSGVVPQPQIYYHVVGVWNKEEGKVYIYVNGELKNKVDAVGDLKFPTSGCTWFCIGGDAGPTGAQLGWSGDIVLARIYDKPLVQKDIDLLWNDVNKQYVAPKSVLLDVVFNPDGTASDVSPLKNIVQTIPGSKTMTYYNKSLDRYVAWFDHAPGSVTSTGYYKINFEPNTEFRNALADGHSLEVLYMFNDDLPMDVEVKPFSAMQAGGTGFILSNNPSGNDSKINFITHIGGDWRYAYGGLKPEKGTYYHVIGVWDKNNQCSRIYINGELKYTATTVGDFKFPATSANWFCIGGDASATTSESAWRGDVAIARVYNDPLSDASVQELWNAVKNKIVDIPFSINNITFLPSVSLAIGSNFTIIGSGFHDGDKIKLIATADEERFYDIDATLKEDVGALTIRIPEMFESGEYKMFAVRASEAVPLGAVNITVGDEGTLASMPKITAHRGYWTNGVPQNSIAGFKAAYELGVYNSEADFWLSKDNVIVCSHDQSIQGLDIPTSNYYGGLENVKLSNGEKLPILQDYLDVMTDDEHKDFNMKLLIEIKPNNNALAAAIVGAVAVAGLEEKVEYISFSYSLCQYLATIVPKGTIIGYINGDKRPNDFSEGINLMNYNINVIRNNPGWIKEAHDRGIMVAVWTIGDSTDDFIEFINRGVDCISTDYPQSLKRLQNLFLIE